VGKEFSRLGVVAEWFKAAVLKGDPALSDSVLLNPPPPCCVCDTSQIPSASVSRWSAQNWPTSAAC